MLRRSLYMVASILLSVFTQTIQAQTAELHGQASGWLTANPQDQPASLFGLRYIPDLLAEQPLGGGFDANVELSLNAFATAQFVENQTSSYDATLKLYRGWFRLSTDRFEVRIGLQKINFGSALLLRPLMWFDRVDPRDPLQLTDGVYGGLARYSLQDNANFWLWGLYGNNGTKGWESVPTEKKTIEYGGRAQSPLWTGEIGLTYHHRRADLSPLMPAHVDTDNFIAPEDRLGLDGKWDIGIGAWFETAIIRQNSALLRSTYQRQWTVGGDYTFSIGNGLYAATEYFRSDNSSMPFGSAEGVGFSALTLSYPVEIVDEVSTILYRDWKDQQWYRLMTWKRTYDNWSFYLLAFWNPDTIQILQSTVGSNAFAGTGFQVMVVFNH